jgi:hypothetical protein
MTLNVCFAFCATSFSFTQEELKENVNLRRSSCRVSVIFVRCKPKLNLVNKFWKKKKNPNEIFYRISALWERSCSVLTDLVKLIVGFLNSFAKAPEGREVWLENLKGISQLAVFRFSSARFFLFFMVASDSRIQRLNVLIKYHPRNQGFSWFFQVRVCVCRL